MRLQYMGNGNYIGGAANMLGIGIMAMGAAVPLMVLRKAFVEQPTKKRTRRRKKSSRRKRY